MIQKLSILGMLGICSLDDIRNRQVRLGILVGFMVEAMLGWIFLWEKPMESVFISMIPGLVFFILAYITKGAIGEGDGLVLIVAGVFSGISCILRVLVSAVFLSSGYALFLSIVRKKSRKYEMPFVPFLLLGFVGDFLLESLY